MIRKRKPISEKLHPPPSAEAIKVFDYLCDCGCSIQFIGRIPKRHKCFRCKKVIDAEAEYTANLRSKRKRTKWASEEKKKVTRKQGRRLALRKAFVFKTRKKKKKK